MSVALVEARNVSIRFGGLCALADFQLRLARGELVGLIGPNGAGKTTAFNLLTGIYAPTSGGIFVEGRPIQGLRPHQIATRGVARTFQNIRLFKELTALDNVRIACRPAKRISWLRALLQTPASLREEEAMLDRSDRLLDVMGLSHRREELAKNLPYGEQRRLEIARALATSPGVLLLDEPAAGMNANEKVELMALIHRIREEFSVAILIIEHDMKLVMGVCERLIVLDHGVLIASGTPEEVRANPRVIEAYLGKASGASSAGGDRGAGRGGGGGAPGAGGAALGGSASAPGASGAALGGSGAALGGNGAGLGGSDSDVAAGGSAVPAAAGEAK